MCGMVLGLISSVIGAFGQMQQANAAAAAAKFNAQISEMNAQIAEDAAKDELDRGAREEQKHRMKVGMLRGNQRVAMAANGVDLGSGSPAEVLFDTAYAGEMDSLGIRVDTNVAAYNRRVQAVNYRAQAQLYRMEAKAARTGGMLGALGTLTGGIGKFASSFAT